MGFADKIRSVLKGKRTRISEEYIEYKSCVELNQNDIVRFKKYISHFSSVAAENKEKNSNAYKNAMEEVHRFQYCLYEFEKASKFIRPNTFDDIEYRNAMFNSFADKLKDVYAKDSDFRFHGTPIYFAEEILKSGVISSTADRFDGYVKSTDAHGEISVADINGLSRVINYFLDMQAYSRCLPCGCLFVLNGEGQTLEQKECSVMNSVDFKKNPERLYSIITTPENIEKVKDWLLNSQMSVSLVQSFDDFLVEQEKKHSVIISANEKMSLNGKIADAGNKCNCFVACKQQTKEFVRQ